ncbi:hypothetical protein IEU95_15930 [Hoyosella rhizosphaerae]|uniref:Uncharacterized protein n=1 Tax=Hoyosella rhizosphaerae TaxID=1755582 RepID=A0A916XJ29_9ACTN|nr:hypothetical protein [Hoyosella rhizosphaerae]MBN4928325.1 hypothetical protein [Hoyosella rhizosphaerae]GGC74104.1 hypothetical protein GCM10011410_29130 [Hoyosella rhizosphaerae]
MTAPGLGGGDRRSTTADGQLTVAPDYLREVAAKFVEHAGVVGGLDPGAGVARLGACLPGSATASRCPRVTGLINQALGALATRSEILADLARGTAEDYDVTEASFVVGLGGFGGGQ